MPKCLKSLLTAPCILLFLVATGGQALASEPVNLETETRTAPGYQSQMPCGVSEMALMCPAMESGTSAADDSGDHAAHHPATETGDFGLEDSLTQSVTQIKEILNMLTEGGTQ